MNLQIRSARRNPGDVLPTLRRELTTTIRQELEVANTTQAEEIATINCEIDQQWERDYSARDAEFAELYIVKVFLEEDRSRWTLVHLWIKPRDRFVLLACLGSTEIIV